ncbi:hypothetical protein GEA64_04040 [Photorhabdus khanii]|uniref:Uncharacterized protein n=1 Tax=Photorhabdus khanii TaxID=1004150 RepID=A0A7C9GMP4_9GAMM|nr:hypothetical protein [Photorhabdus khanii]MQL47215.1 hypothetical protein [Photorhabdus khanii]
MIGINHQMIPLKLAAIAATRSLPQSETGYYGGAGISSSTRSKDGFIRFPDYNKPIATTKSKGGFGSTSSARSSWGG